MVWEQLVLVVEEACLITLMIPVIVPASVHENAADTLTGVLNFRLNFNLDLNRRDELIFLQGQVIIAEAHRIVIDVLALVVPLRLHSQSVDF